MRQHPTDSCKSHWNFHFMWISNHRFWQGMREKQGQCLQAFTAGKKALQITLSTYNSGFMGWKVCSVCVLTHFFLRKSSQPNQWCLHSWTSFGTSFFAMFEIWHAWSPWSGLYFRVCTSLAKVNAIHYFSVRYSLYCWPYFTSFWKRYKSTTQHFHLHTALSNIMIKFGS